MNVVPNYDQVLERFKYYDSPPIHTIVHATCSTRLSFYIQKTATSSSAESQKSLLTNFPLYSNSSCKKNLFTPMAAESTNLSTITPATADDDDLQYGFKRPEMYSEVLKGKIEAYDRQVVICYKGPEAWPHRVEDAEDDILPKVFMATVKARKNDIALKMKVTVCGGGGGSGLEDGDVLLFPDMVVYRGLKESDVDGFVEEVLVRGEPWSAGKKEEVTATYVFVCAHASRDTRCGVCGPVLLDRLKKEIGTRGLSGKVITTTCSHIGQHKYAGNLMIYGTAPNGLATGHWYGYVTPDDVPDLLDSHIGKGQIVEKIWRGQMGAYEFGKGEEKKHTEEPKLVEKAPSGCCQGANRVSCCRDESSELKSNPNPCSKRFECISGWIGSLEQRDVLSAAAVVSAVVTVAVGYTFYRRSA